MKFSVLISIYPKESPKFFSQSLDSLVAQTVPADEVVIVKDGSVSSELESVLDQYATKLPLKVVGYEQNRGLGYALAFGLRQCRYDWVARMDSDDIAVENRFEKQTAFLSQHSDIDLLGCATMEFSDTISDSRQGRILPCRHEEIVSFLKKRNAFNHMTVFFRKQTALNAGNYREMPGFEDYDLWVRMVVNGARTANLPEPLVYARTGNDMIGRRIGWQYAKNEFRFYKKIHELKFLTFKEFIKIIFIRIPLRLLPKKILELIYKKVLRK